MEQLHERYQIETINNRFYRAKLKPWDKVGEMEPLYSKTT